jgi:hypothetical protein
MRNKLAQPVWQVSGESTPSAQVPDEFIPLNRQTNNGNIGANLQVPPDWNGNVRRQPIVQRAERTVGMKYLYSRRANRQPIHPLGADGTPNPYTSRYQPNLMGGIRNGSFNYALYQAGYPGFNLGLSFKVPSINNETGRSPNGPGYAMNMKGPTKGLGRRTGGNQ